jgi:hypothetical protein
MGHAMIALLALAARAAGHGDSCIGVSLLRFARMGRLRGVRLCPDIGRPSALRAGGVESAATGLLKHHPT